MSISQRTLSRPPADLARPALSDPGIQLVIEALGRLRYGAIQLTVHEGRLVQVDVTERNRFAAS